MQAPKHLCVMYGKWPMSSSTTKSVPSSMNKWQKISILLNIMNGRLAVIKKCIVIWAIRYTAPMKHSIWIFTMVKIANIQQSRPSMKAKLCTSGIHVRKRLRVCTLSPKPLKFSQKTKNSSNQCHPRITIPKISHFSEFWNRIKYHTWI